TRSVLTCRTCPMFEQGKRSASSAPRLTLHSTHLARRRSPFGMAPAVEMASDGHSTGGSRRLAVVAVSRFQNRISASYSLKTEHALHRDSGTVEQVRRITSL